MSVRSSQTQEELEQPVKGYQLKAVEDRLDSFEKNMTASIDRLTSTVVSNPSVSPATLQSTTEAMRKEFREHVAQEVKKIHLEYGQMKKDLLWIKRTAGGQIIGLLIQAVVTGLIFRGMQ